jgi:sugar-specific transcriptional regulator TrmB
MYSAILTKLNLSKNEALIYETLLKHGKSSVSTISKHSNIHRRNVYDTLDHLLSKGLVSEIVDSKENTYVAVDPKKLSEILKEKEIELNTIMPQLQEMYSSKPIFESVFIYKGIEGWKNYLRDVLEIGEDLYTIGGKGAWGDERIQTFLKDFLEKAAKKKINFYILYDGEESDIPSVVLKTSKDKHKFLPKKYSNNSAIEIFGDRVVIFSNIVDRKIDNNATLTVIKNKNVADAFRTWFKMIWDLV